MKIWNQWNPLIYYTKTRNCAYCSHLFTREKVMWMKNNPSLQSGYIEKLKDMEKIKLLFNSSLQSLLINGYILKRIKNVITDQYSFFIFDTLPYLLLIGMTSLIVIELTLILPTPKVISLCYQCRARLDSTDGQAL